jgi:hypothetical protein
MAHSGGSLRTLFSSAFGEDRTCTDAPPRSAAPLLTQTGHAAMNFAVMYNSARA